jgi:hypothetical protein
MDFEGTYLVSTSSKPSASVRANIGNAAGAMPFKIGDREISYTLIDQDTKAKLEGVLAARARNILKKDKDFMSDEEYGIAYGVYHDRALTGFYTFGSKAFKEWFKTEDGIANVLNVCTGVPVKDWGKILQEHPEEVAELIGLIMDISFPNWRATLTGQ